jgi:hypothetical protein
VLVGDGGYGRHRLGTDEAAGEAHERIARMTRHSTCMPVGAKQPAEAEPSTPDTDAENEVAERV